MGDGCFPARALRMADAQRCSLTGASVNFLEVPKAPPGFLPCGGRAAQLSPFLCLSPASEPLAPGSGCPACHLLEHCCSVRRTEGQWRGGSTDYHAVLRVQRRVGGSELAFRKAPSNPHVRSQSEPGSLSLSFALGKSACGKKGNPHTPSKLLEGLAF